MALTLIYEDFQPNEQISTEFEQFVLPPPEIQELIKTPLPEYSEGVEQISTKRRKDLDSDAGKYWERSVLMSDGQRHTEILGLSNSTKASELVVSIPAWWTRLDGGVNKVTSDAFLRRSKHTLIKGVSENKPSPLSRGAHDMHTVLDYDSKDGLNYYFDPNKIYVQGDSNGAMQGTGIIAYANKHKREVVDAFLVDPCFVRKFSHEDFKKALEHPSYAPKELISLARQIGRMASHPDIDLKECSKSLESNPARLLGNLMLTKALFSGEFGLLLAHLPKQQREHFVLFNHSLANQKQHALKILGAIGSSATVTLRTGTHISIADPRILENKLSYLTAGNIPDGENNTRVYF